MLLVHRDCRSFAFTLIELFAVMAIIAVLMALTLGAMRGLRERAAISRARSELAFIAQALEAYRRHYGDYPRTGDQPQAQPDPGRQALNRNLAPVKLFNALTGVFGPAAFNANDRLNGPIFLDVGRLSLEPAVANQPALSTGFQQSFIDTPGRPPLKHEETTCLLDPWGGRYLYYYRGVSPNTPWRVPGFVLYSAGPDRTHTAPPLTGVLTQNDFTSASNTDNIYYGH